MRLSIKMISLLMLTTFMVSAHADVYKWKDQYGKTQYGDNPPPGSRAEPVKMPAITVIENYGQQWQPTQEMRQQDQDNSSSSPSSSGYTALNILAPKAGQGIRANDGDVTVMLSTEPKLKRGHMIVVNLDGKEISRGTNRAVNIPNLDRGEHSLIAEIRDAHNRSLISSGSINFTVLRHSILLNKNQKTNINPNPYNLGYDKTNAQSPWVTKK